MWAGQRTGHTQSYTLIHRQPKLIPMKGPWVEASVCDGIKESAQVGVDASTQGGANLPYGAERVNKQVGVMLGWNTLQTLAQSLDTLPSP